VAVISMKALLEAGVHFGHRTRRWNPKMKPYIFTERNGIHIIDLQQTLSNLTKAYTLVQETVGRGGTVLFVGTKKQAQESVAQEAMRCGMPFVTQRWLGGTLTNWRTIRSRIDQLIDLEEKLNSGEFGRLTKKEALEKQRLVTRLQGRLGGMRTMTRLPDLVFITDTRREALAVAEANKLKIPIIALVDTNCDPDPIDLVIPANDDAIRAIKLLVGKIADAVIEGQQLRARLEAEAQAEREAGAARAQAAEEGELEGIGDERYLAPGLLAKLRSGMFQTEGLEEEDEFAEYEYSEEEAEAAPPAESEPSEPQEQ
jgi:small subunit ribosomal protein S2